MAIVGIGSDGIITGILRRRLAFARIIVLNGCAVLIMLRVRSTMKYD
jgi:hypothetical protein